MLTHKISQADQDSDFTHHNLVIRIYETPIRGKHTPEELSYAHRVDFPGTCSVLALDQGDRYDMLYDYNLFTLRVQPEQAFKIANSNSLLAGSHMEQAEIGGCQVYLITHTDFAALQALDLAASISSGDKGNGVLMGIPSTDHCYVYRLEELDDEAFFNMVLTFFCYNYDVYRTAKQPIISTLYWYHNAEPWAFDIKVSADHISVRYPQLLQAKLDGNFRQSKKTGPRDGHEKFGKGELLKKGRYLLDEKKLLSVHADVVNGAVNVFERDMHGVIIGMSDRFNI